MSDYKITNQHHKTLTDRIQYLSAGTKYDSCNQGAVCHAFGPDGRCIQLYKTLITNSCAGSCTYCPNRYERDTSRVSLTSDEIIKITWSFYRRNAIEGLFLSSGIIGDAENTSQKQLDIATKLRTQGFKGYIHIRLMPGVPKYIMEQIAEVANKFGVNAETINSLNYSEICPNFDYKNDILQRLKWSKDLINRKRKELGFKNRIIGSNDTQFVIGAIQESDKEIIRTVHKFMHKYELRRPYFMSFDPVPDTPLEKNIPSPKWREVRLYQASYLLKDYALSTEDFDKIYTETGNLYNKDPKVLLAQCNKELFPVDINKATLHQLLLVPGIGPISANRIIKSRPFENEQQIVRMGVVISRARPYIKINNKSQTNFSNFMGECT